MEQDLQQLEQVLRDQLAAHERLGQLLEEKLTALRQADHGRVAQCTRLENEQVQTIARLEKARLELVAGLTLALKPDAAEPMALPDLAQRLEEPVRGRLLVLRAELKDRMIQVQKKTSVARRTAETLVAHMQGLMQAVTSAVAGAATYSARGATAGASAVSTFNTTA